MDEFELTFLPRELPAGVRRSPAKEMLDIYVPTVSDHPHLRIRKSGERYEITKKEPAQGTDASHQIETTIPLSREEFEELAQIPGRRVEKTRYLYEEKDRTYEVDVFGGELKGLVLADIEFASAEDMASYTRPDLMLAEVTNEKLLAGGMLSGASYADIEPVLTKLGYQKLV